MKKIELKTVETEGGQEINYSELCRACLRVPAKQGYSIEEMEVRLTALRDFPSITRDEQGKLEPLTCEEITVSEETYKELLKCLKDFRWGVIDQAFIDFDKYIKSLAVTSEK
jgi:hypothetical protein